MHHRNVQSRGDMMMHLIPSVTLLRTKIIASTTKTPIVTLDVGVTAQSSTARTETLLPVERDLIITQKLMMIGRIPGTGTKSMDGIITVDPLTMMVTRDGVRRNLITSGMVAQMKAEAGEEMTGKEITVEKGIMIGVMTEITTEITTGITIGLMTGITKSHTEGQIMMTEITIKHPEAITMMRSLVGLVMFIDVKCLEMTDILVTEIMETTTNSIIELFLLIFFSVLVIICCFFNTSIYS